MKLFELYEAKKPTKTKTKDDLASVFDNEYASPVIGTDKPLKKADKVTTARKLAQIAPIHNAPNISMPEFSDQEFTSDLDLAHQLDYETPTDEPEPTTDNLPVNPSQDVTGGRRNRGTDVSTDQNTVSPDWVEVSDLPGYMQQGIRMMGRRVFQSMTSSPLENMNVITSMTHSDLEVNSVTQWIRDNGSELDNVTMIFDNIPGYEATARLWTAGDKDFLLVKDFAGKYIYSWPSRTRVGH